MSDMKDAKNGNGYNAEEAWAHKQNKEALDKLKAKSGQGADGDKADGDKGCGDKCKGDHKGACKKKAGCPRCDANAKKK